MHPRELATNDRIILALADARSLAETIAAARRFAPAVGVFKVGLQLYIRYGPEPSASSKQSAKCSST